MVINASRLQTSLTWWSHGFLSKVFLVLNFQELITIHKDSRADSTSRWFRCEPLFNQIVKPNHEIQCNCFSTESVLELKQVRKVSSANYNNLPNLKTEGIRAVASGPASPVLAGSLSAIGNFAKDRDTLIEQSVCYSNRTVNTTPPIDQWVIVFS